MNSPSGRAATSDPSQIRSLTEVNVGSHATVIVVEGEPELRRRLLEMGFCNGVDVKVVRKAPLGDPIEFQLRGYNLSLRREQARHVKVETKPVIP